MRRLRGARDERECDGVFDGTGIFRYANIPREAKRMRVLAFALSR
jgi:hypothetical protein